LASDVQHLWQTDLALYYEWAQTWSFARRRSRTIPRGRRGSEAVVRHPGARFFINEFEAYHKGDESIRQFVVLEIGD
jgi:hypothetical protein